MSRPPRTADDGYVLVIVLMAMVIGIGFAVAGLATALNSRTFSTRDQRVRRAQHAADAGIQSRLYQQSQIDLGSTSYNFNGGTLGLSSLVDCNVPQVSLVTQGSAQVWQVTGTANVAASSAGVCPPSVDGNGTTVTNFNPTLGNHTSYQSELFTGQTVFLNGTSIGSQNGSSEIVLKPKIVAVGKEDTNIPSSSGPVYSRQLAILYPWAPLQAIEGQHDVTINGLTALGMSTLAAMNGNVIARHNLATPAAFASLNLSASPSLAATLAYGNTLSGGLTVSNAQQVAANQIVERPPIKIDPAKPNCAVAANCSALGSAYNGSAGVDTFTATSGTYTFAPGDYVFCNFSATGSAVINASPSTTTPVRIFIDSPTSSRCAGDSMAKSGGVYTSVGNFTAANGVNNGLLSSVTSALAASGVQIYLAGDQAPSAQPPYDNANTVTISPQPTCTGYSILHVCLGSNAPPTQSMIVYAPTSKVTVNTGGCLVGTLGACTLGNAGLFQGAVIGNDVNMTATTITQDLDIGNYPLYAGINAFRVQQYVQCDTSVTQLTGSVADLNGC